MRIAICPVMFTIVLLSCLGGAAAQEPSIAPLKFTDVTAQTKLDKYLHGAFTHALAWGDFDGDGRPDLFLGTFAERSPVLGRKEAPANMLLRQLPGGTFAQFPSPAVEIPARCSGAVFADLDNDGDLDLYVSSNTMVKPTSADPRRRTAQGQGSKLYRNDGAGKYVDVSKESGACPDSLVRCRDIGVFDYDNDGLLDLFVMQDIGIRPEDKLVPLQLFRNLGDLKFENVADKLGFPGDLWSAGIAVGDINGDRRPDLYLCGCNRLFLSQPDKTYAEDAKLRTVFQQPEKELDWVTGAVFGDLDRDGDLDLVTGRHHYFGPSRIHVYLNEGIHDGVPRFREITNEVIGLTALPQKTPHPEIQDFDNDGIPDIYWSTFFARGDQRWPFICRGLGVKDGLPRFAVPDTKNVKAIYDDRKRVQNTVPENELVMVYYVDGPAVDFDGDGDLDFLCGNWPPEGSRFYRNDSPAKNWLQVEMQGKKMNRMGIGAQVRVYPAGKAGQAENLLGFQEISVNVGYSSSRPALAHFGLGSVERVDLEIQFPTRAAPLGIDNVAANRRTLVAEP